LQQDETLRQQEDGDRKRDRWKLAQWAVAIILLSLVVIGCVVLFPAQLASRDADLRHIDRSKLENDVRTTLLQGVAGLLVVVGGIATWRQLDTNRLQLRQTLEANRRQFALTREGQITERFTHAIEQLGGENLDLKVGGIYALERIARDSRSDSIAIREILAAYVRGHSRWPSDKRGLAADRLSDLPPLRIRTDDVQTAMTVLARKSLFGDQPGQYTTTGMSVPQKSAQVDGVEPERIILAEVDLRGAYLRDASLERVDFTKAHLERADFIGSHLRDARLRSANLRQAVLTNADLTGANLIGARLEGAHLESARLDDAQLVRAHLQGAYLIRTSLVGANLRFADLRGANMIKCDLTNCDLRGATGLDEVHGLEQEELSRAITDQQEEGLSE
jgi:uncharacterized protein YjbI with pentapeptide repeats